MESRQRLRGLAISQTGFVFDPYSGVTFTVNPTGERLLLLLRDGRGSNEIGDALKQEFDVMPDDDVGRDVDEFLHLLRDLGILPREASPERAEGEG